MLFVMLTFVAYGLAPSRPNERCRLFLIASSFFHVARRRNESFPRSSKKILGVYPAFHLSTK